MTKVFLFGTFHFRESDIDFFSDDIQKQLEVINEKLIRFNPDAITDESPIQAQEIVNIAYDKFTLEDLKKFDYARSEPLGQVSMWGNTHTLTYDKAAMKNERFQIAFRMGKTLGLDKIYSIDDDTLFKSINEDSPEYIKNAFDNRRKKMDIGNGSILEMLRNINSEEWSYHNQQLYVVNNEIGAGASYAGAECLASWYERNLKIFANLQKLCRNHKRIFSLYGAGHLYILRVFINTCEYMELVDYRDYL